MEPKTLYKLSYGMYLVTTKLKERLNAQIANTVFQITSEPALIAVSINQQNLTHQMIKESKVINVSILSQDTPMSFIGHFGFKSGRDIDKFAEVKYKLMPNGLPLIEDFSIGHLYCEVSDAVDLNTHTIFIAKVIDAEIINQKEPMTYAYYHQVKRGLAPSTAPTFIKEELSMEKQTAYICTVCGYVYDPAKGDPENGILPGTPFEELPENWVCPICGAGKDQFEQEA